MAKRPLLHTQQDQGEMIQYAIRLSDRKLVHVNDVLNGKDCDCICPSPQCRSPLIAVNGSNIQVTPHFRHDSGGNNSRPCANAAGIRETVTHIKAKEWIERNRQVILPYITITKEDDADGCTYQSVSIKNAERVKLDRVELEHSEDSFIPDCTAYIGNRKLFIEVYVHHKVDQEKSVKVRHSGIDTIEINFNKGFVEPTDEALKEIILNPIHTKWIFCNEKESPQNVGRAKLSFDKTRAAFDKALAEKRLRNRLLAREKHVENLAKQYLSIKQGVADPNKRLNAHFKKIGLDERSRKIEAMISDLERDIYPYGLSKDPIVTDLCSQFKLALKRTVESIKRSNSEAYFVQHSEKYNISYFTKIAEEDTPSVEDDSWKKYEDMTIVNYDYDDLF